VTTGEEECQSGSGKGRWVGGGVVTERVFNPEAVTRQWHREDIPVRSGMA